MNLSILNSTPDDTLTHFNYVQFHMDLEVHSNIKLNYFLQILQLFYCFHFINA